MHTPAGKSQQRGGGGGFRTPGGGGGGAHPFGTPRGGGVAGGVGAAAPLTFSASKHTKSMRAQKAAGTNKASSKTLFKPALASPFSLPWDALTVEQSMQVLRTLHDTLPPREAHTAAHSSAAETAASAAAAALPIAASPASHSGARTLKRKRADTETAAGSVDEASSHGVYVGINAVTRAAERNELSLLLVCRSVTPLALVAHLPVLCHLRRIPLLTLHPQVNSRMLAEAIRSRSSSSSSTTVAVKAQVSSAGAAAISTDPTKHSTKQRKGIQLCMAIGLQRGALEQTLSALQEFATIPAVPWLSVPATLAPPLVLHTGPQERPAKQPKVKQVPPAAAVAAAAAAGAAAPKNAAGDAASSGTSAVTVSAPSNAAQPRAGGGGGGGRERERFQSATQRRKLKKAASAAARAASSAPASQAMTD